MCIERKCMNFLRMYIWKSSKEEIVACVGKGKEKARRSTIARA